MLDALHQAPPGMPSATLLSAWLWLWSRDLAPNEAMPRRMHRRWSRQSQNPAAGLWLLTADC